MSKDPHSEPDTEKSPLMMRVGVDDQGCITLFDAVTGREVYAISKVVVEDYPDHEGVQTASITFYTDSRLITEEARSIIESGEAEVEY